MNTHTGDKPYQCSRRDKGFLQSSNLVSHMRTHTEDKQNQCSPYDKVLRAKINLERHEIFYTQTIKKELTEDEINDTNHFSDPKCKLENLSELKVEIMENDIYN